MDIKKVKENILNALSDCSETAYRTSDIETAYKMAVACEKLVSAYTMLKE